MAVRKRKKSKVIRVSEEVYKTLQARGKKMRKKTMNEVLRKVLGLPSEHYPERRKAKDFWLLPSALRIFRKQGEARGEAIVEAIKKGRKRAESPVRVREVL